MANFFCLPGFVEDRLSICFSRGRLQRFFLRVHMIRVWFGIGHGLLGSAPTGTGTIALDSTFGSFTLLEPVSLVKMFRLFRLDQIFWVFRVWTQ
jgi:hypothetical protein